VIITFINNRGAGFQSTDGMLEFQAARDGQVLKYERTEQRRRCAFVWKKVMGLRLREQSAEPIPGEGSGT